MDVHGNLLAQPLENSIVNYRYLPIHRLLTYSAMSNLLSIPFKKTYAIEIKDATRAFISKHGGVHPDEFREDIISWQHLRKKATSDTVHENGIDAMLLSVLFFIHCDSHPSW